MPHPPDSSEALIAREQTIMTHGHFAWTDLSTYDLPTARSDYAELFSWQFTGDNAYDFAFLGEAEVAAIFEMPAKLVEINMPSFWMSYVQVDDLEDVVAKARTHDNVIVEVEPEGFGNDARIYNLHGFVVM